MRSSVRMMTIRSKTPSMLPRIAPSTAVERPWPPAIAPVADVDEEDEIEDELEDVWVDDVLCGEV